MFGESSVLKVCIYARLVLFCFGFFFKVCIYNSISKPLFGEFVLFLFLTSSASL